MYQRCKDAEPGTYPQYDVIGAGFIEQQPAQIHAQERDDLMAEKDKAE